MRKEFWIFLCCGIFFAIVAPIYWVVSPHEISGAVPFGMTALLFFMVSFYLWFVGREIPPRPEDRNDGEIADGAGELGFFPPYSWWPLAAALAVSVTVSGIAVGWWMFMMGLPIAALAMIGWTFEFYRGRHAH